ncbi:NAD(P)/FAD-dependent oxidoreductase [Tateyamaria sp. SN6-1]|uniref:NAD(P)/FAD-dependent oxidoreductase n=1 Tax=Tateyamaria sp. SN6-1 TaxID=3092148 RepID=UPI0039F4F757
MRDVVIAGGGPAGLAVAIALAERGVDAVVVDSTGGLSTQRAELLPQGAAAIVTRLGLGHVLHTARVIEDVVSVWGTHGHGAHPGLGLHGWGVDRSLLAHDMVARVTGLDIPVVTARILSQQRGSDGWTLCLSGAADIRARFVIDATGRAGSIARKQGATALHGQDLVAVTWHMPEHTGARMLAEAAPDGWWYLVPAATGATLGFMTEASRAKGIHANPAPCLDTAARTLTCIDVRGAAPRPRLMDSRSAVIDTPFGAGWLATGDASASFDPIASQGLFNALSAGFFAGHAAADTLAGDADAARTYAMLCVQTAERTHAATHLQYAARPFDTPFWNTRAAPHAQKKEASPVPA